jgi:hypothetical protein
MDTTFWLENPKRMGHLDDLGIAGKIIELIFEN